MTAKERLAATVIRLSETEAEAALEFIASRRESFDEWFDSRPNDDEPLTEPERAALIESAEDVAEGRTVSLAELRQSLGEP